MNKQKLKIEQLLEVETKQFVDEFWNLQPCEKDNQLNIYLEDVLLLFLLAFCDKEHYIFGESMVEELAMKHQIPLSEKIPMDSKLADACDNGKIEYYENSYLTEFAKALKNIISEKE